ncbi:MAG: hypothetical protein AAF409_16105 [Pseudomonadota bacterium]
MQAIFLTGVQMLLFGVWAYQSWGALSVCDPLRFEGIGLVGTVAFFGCITLVWYFWQRDIFGPLLRGSDLQAAGAKLREMEAEQGRSLALWPRIRIAVLLMIAALCQFFVGDAVVAAAAGAGLAACG